MHVWGTEEAAEHDTSGGVGGRQGAGLVGTEVGERQCLFFKDSSSLGGELTAEEHGCSSTRFPGFISQVPAGGGDGSGGAQVPPANASWSRREGDLQAICLPGMVKDTPAGLFIPLTRTLQETRVCF